MELKILSLNVRGLNKTTKRRQLFRWLHQKKFRRYFHFKKRIRAPKLLSSGKLNGVAKLLKVMALITAVV